MQMMDVKNRERSEHSLLGEMRPKLSQLSGYTSRPETQGRKYIYCIYYLFSRRGKRGELNGETYV